MDEEDDDATEAVSPPAAATAYRSGRCLDRYRSEASNAVMADCVDDR
jgi:hypothetical protein